MSIISVIVLKMAGSSAVSSTLCILKYHKMQKDISMSDVKLAEKCIVLSRELNLLTLLKLHELLLSVQYS